jgi:peptidoglycan hydrolase-like protein with peptidoglycan-binding domain
MSEKITISLPLLKKGSQEYTAVRRLQELANYYLAGNGGEVQLIVDGNFGPKTDDAVRFIQRNNGLRVDGVVGTQTWTTLLEYWLNNPLD